ncbi:MAG: cell division protein FtsZ [Acidobacteria bacterium]|nr:cell division protein FtsZ [Acidobacteriota bacterium]
MNKEMDLFGKKDTLFTIDEARPASARIAVVGIGGAGGNLIRRMVEAGMEGIELIAADTDVQALRNSLAPIKLELGTNITRGIGCNGNPRSGRQAAMEETERILDLLEGADMVFIAGGEGGGTYTGAAPVFASLASSTGALAIGTAIMPFSFQGAKARTYAEVGLREMEESLDSIIVVPNETLLRTLDKSISLNDALHFADDLVCRAIRSISEIVANPGIIKLNLADVCAVMQHRGTVFWGNGIAEGSNRAADAAHSAIRNLLGEEAPIQDAKAALINIAGSRHCLKLHETEEAAEVIKAKTGLEDVLIGAMYDDGLGDKLKLTVIAAGFGSGASEQISGCDRSIRPEVPAVKVASQFSAAYIAYRESNWEDLDRPSFQRRRATLQ